MRKKFDGVNWNRPVDDFTLMFWNQNTQQIWLDTEIPLGEDKNTWSILTPAEQDVFKKVFGGLTFLDTQQGINGMTALSLHIKDHQREGVLMLMGWMECMHAKSYSSVFSTILTMKEIDEVFKWGEDNPFLQYKARKIVGYYDKLLFNRYASDYDIYMAIVASVFLESFLFYSGFYYPLYLGGQGKMTRAKEVIQLICRDEAIHGAFCGILAQEFYKKLTSQQQAQATVEMYELLEDLMTNELHYTQDIYTKIGLQEQVEDFLKYNANRALMNLGFESYYAKPKVSPVIINGLSAETKTHDFFSQKGNSYFKVVDSSIVEDKDFLFNGDELDKLGV